MIGNDDEKGFKKRGLFFKPNNFDLIVFSFLDILDISLYSDWVTQTTDQWC